MPDGCSEDDIPGYNDVDGELDVECSCGFKGNAEGVFSPQGEGALFSFTCPACGETNEEEVQHEVG